MVATPALDTSDHSFVVGQKRPRGNSGNSKTAEEKVVKKIKKPSAGIFGSQVVTLSDSYLCYESFSCGFELL
jgi:hypothetical protein